MDPVLLMQLCMVEKIAFQFQMNNMYCKPAQLNRTFTNNIHKKNIDIYIGKLDNHKNLMSSCW